MKKMGVGLSVCLLATTLGFSQFRGAGEFSFKGFLGYSLAQTKGLSRYADVWDGKVVSDIEEYADIHYRAANGVALGGALSYMFSPNFGLEFGIAFFSQKIPNDTLAGWDFASEGASFTGDYAFSGEGKMTVVPVFLNAVGRFSSGRLDFTLSGGPALYLSNAEATATGIFGDNYWDVRYLLPWGWITMEDIDFFPLAMEVHSLSWADLGFNVGAGLDFNLSAMMALSLDIRYFFCPPQDLTWTYLPGIYNGQRGHLLDWEISAGEAEYPGKNTTAYRVNPSFFYIAAGFSIRFGSGSGRP